MLVAELHLGHQQATNIEQIWSLVMDKYAAAARIFLI